MFSKAEGKRPIRYELPQDTTVEPGWVRKRANAIEVTASLLNSEHDDSPTPRASSPGTPKSPFKIKSNKPPTRRRSGSSAIPQRPKLIRKAATAPPGTILFFSAKPQPPRRAISARAPRLNYSRESRVRQDSLMSSLLPRLSHFGTPASRSLISRRKSSTKTIGKSVLKPKLGVWRMIRPETLKKYERISNAMQDTETGSFSGKLRVKEALRKKNVQLLKTNIVDFKERELPDTPNSMVNTPRELYGTPPEFPKSTPPQPRSRLGRRLDVHPTSPNRAKHFSLPSTPIAQERLRSQSPKQDKWMQPVYAPGPIRLLDAPTTVSRTDSVATMEPFAGAVEGNHMRRSDEVALDGLVAYFQTFGFADGATEDEFDKYWERQGSETYGPPKSPSAKAFRTLGLDASRSIDARPPVPSLPSSGSASLLTFKGSRQQDERQPAPPSPSPIPRQRLRLRRLFSSAASIL